MKPHHDTTDFLVTQSGDELEIWVDWIPAVDGDANSPLQARLEADVLVIEPVGEGHEMRVCRRVQGLEMDLIKDLARGFSWYISGPSGVLGSHHLKLA